MFFSLEVWALCVSHYCACTKWHHCCIFSQQFGVHTWWSMCWTGWRWSFSQWWKGCCWFLRFHGQCYFFFSHATWRLLSLLITQSCWFRSELTLSNYRVGKEMPSGLLLLVKESISLMKSGERLWCFSSCSYLISECGVSMYFSLLKLNGLTAANAVWRKAIHKWAR